MLTTEQVGFTSSTHHIVQCYWTRPTPIDTINTSDWSGCRDNKILNFVVKTILLIQYMQFTNLPFLHRPQMQQFHQKSHHKQFHKCYCSRFLLCLHLYLVVCHSSDELDHQYRLKELKKIYFSLKIPLRRQMANGQRIFTIIPLVY